jgi:hypothetical protein
MTWTAADWRFLRAPLLTMLAVLLLGAAMVFLSHQWLDQSRGVLKQQQDALQ